MGAAEADRTNINFVQGSLLDCPSYSTGDANRRAPPLELGQKGVEPPLDHGPQLECIFRRPTSADQCRPPEGPGGRSSIQAGIDDLRQAIEYRRCVSTLPEDHPCGPTGELEQGRAQQE